MAEPTQKQRMVFARMGIAMPDGSYYIRTASELSDAIEAVGRGNADHDKIRKHIIMRANALHLQKMIPDNWNPDGSEKSAAQSSIVEAGQAFVEHFGVKGMHWGVRRPGTGTPSSHVSADHLRAQGVDHLIKAHGVKAASNEDLQALVTRLNLESQHARLTATPGRVERGHSFVRTTLGLTKTGIDVVNTVPPAIGAGKKVVGGVKTGVKVVKIARAVHRIA
jgi:hypothetical protein